MGSGTDGALKQLGVEAIVHWKDKYPEHGAIDKNICYVSELYALSRLR
jgi:hypothetical protein